MTNLSELTIDVAAVVPRADTAAVRVRAGQVLERGLPALLRAAAAAQLPARRARPLPRARARGALRAVPPPLRAAPRLHLLQPGPGGAAAARAPRLPRPCPAQGGLRLRGARSRGGNLWTLLRACPGEERLQSSGWRFNSINKGPEKKA